MTLDEILAQEKASDIIAQLKLRRGAKQPNKEAAEKALDPEKHDINDPMIRKDKVVKVDKSEDEGQKVIDTGEESTATRIEKVARIKIALQKLIIKRAVAFLYGNPVEYSADPKGDKQEAVKKAFDRILKDNKVGSLDRKIARATFGYNECAELWFPEEKKKAHDTYGFSTKFKLKSALFSPAFGDTLYPYFDMTGDMVAFSRAFSCEEAAGKTVEYFETYTEDMHYMWKSSSDGFALMEGFPKKNTVGKIPIVYAYQEERETEDVDSLIDRLELLLSNFADTNDYHASPKIFITGDIQGFAKKGESGAIIQGEADATAQYLSWQNAPESVKLEIENLLRLVYTITQTPDISFDSVKGLGAISGVALKLLFMDAHLKVQDKREIFDEYQQRRVSIIKAFIGQFNNSLEAEADNLSIDPEIKPYMITNEADAINLLMIANGGKPIISQKQSVKQAGLVNDTEADYTQIQEEEEKSKTFSIGEPVEA